jgi:hypothetical protein
MVGINWTVLAIGAIGLFALVGLLRGWWKEAITTVFLAFLVFLLLMPQVGQLFINLMNMALNLIWQILPQVALDFLNTFFGGSTSAATPPHIDPSNAQTWLVILAVFVGLAALAGRIILPGSSQAARTYQAYAVTRGGCLLGGLLGAFNGWLMVSLVRTYLAGGHLAGASRAAAALSAPPNEVMIQAVNVPNATIMDSFLPWLFAGVGLAAFFAVFNSRVALKTDKDGFSKTDFKPPLGYQKYSVTKRR